jgi:hypothetical protein
MCFTDTPTITDETASIPAAVLERVPRDQALGLRLIALARAAAALHMAQISPSGSENPGALIPESGGQ